MRFTITDTNDLKREFESDKESLTQLISSIEQSKSEFFQFETKYRNVLKPYAIHRSQIVSINELPTDEDVRESRKMKTTDPF